MNFKKIPTKALSFSLLMLSSYTGSAQEKELNPLPLGQWIVVSEQRSLLRDNKVVEQMAEEAISADEAYIYDFVNDSSARVTNRDKDFSWAFRLQTQDRTIDLINIHGDAENDRLSYLLRDGMLILQRRMEDSDPEDENGTVEVLFTLKLRSY